MKREHPPLPIAWIDAIFARLTGNYGRRFMSLWDGLEVETIKEGWAIDMGGISPESIHYALEHLPAVKAPDLPAFKALCREAPALPERAKLPAPDAAIVDPEGVRRVAAALAVLKRSVRPGRDVRAETVEKLVAKQASGVRLTRFERSVITDPSMMMAVEAEPVEFPQNLPSLPRSDARQ